METATLDLPTFLPYRLSILNKRSSRLLSSVYQSRWGLSVPAWQVMAAVGHFRRVSCQDVGAFAQLDKSAVHRAVKSLVDMGLIQRTTNPDDGREIILSFTTKGRQLYNKIVPLAMNWESLLISTLDEEELSALNSALTKLDTQLQKMEALEP